MNVCEECMGLKRFNHRRGFIRLDLHLLKFCLRVFYDPFTSLKAISILSDFLL